MSAAYLSFSATGLYQPAVLAVWIYHFDDRRSQAEFHCLWCGFEANADENAASNIPERFSDEELNTLPFRAVETALAMRGSCAVSRMPSSASAGLDTAHPLDVPRGKAAAYLLPPTSQSARYNTHGINVHKLGNYVSSQGKKLVSVSWKVLHN